MAKEIEGLEPLFEPPYYAVIFASRHTGQDPEKYGKTAARMLELAAAQDGYLGVETVFDGAGSAMTVSYWRDEQSILNWRRNAEHLEAQKEGRERWYDGFRLRVAKVERERAFP